MPKKGGLKASLFAVALGMTIAAPQSTATANDTIDTMTTGSVDLAAPAIERTAKGSAAFRDALALLDDGDGAQAYERARTLPTVERRAIQWAAIYYHGEDIDYRTVERFMADAPAFASQDLYRIRIEQALTRVDASQDEVLRVLGEAAPQTIDGQIALAVALKAEGETERATTLTRRLWIDNFLSREQEAEVLGKLGGLLTDADHWDRVVRLMMHDRIQGAERLEEHLTAAQKSLLTARAATARRQNDGKKLLDAVDASLHDHPVFIYTRVQRARLAGLYEQAVDWLDKAEGTLPEPAEWWYERRTITRALLADGKPELAYRAAAGYTEGPEGRMVDAQFHAGWIALAFLNDAAAAKRHFVEMAAHSTLPDSITQAHFWLARSEIALGDFAAADAAYGVAAQYGTVYYGQLARGALGLDGVTISPLPDWQDGEAMFDRNEVVRAVRLLAANGKARLAVPLLRHWTEGLTDGAELVLAARLAQEIGAHNVAIAIAEAGQRQGFGMEAFSFPRSGLPEDARFAADKAAVYAVARQESLFQVDAVSHVGARGLMQLMPGTARDTARQVGVDYSAGRLTTDAAYNVLLGSTYLSDQLDRYGGSLLLAAAAYNAGPGNANAWIRAYGDPRAPNVDPVVWVELIPFPETRKYVQRVLGNYLVYRERLGHGAVAIAEVLRKIP